MLDTFRGQSDEQYLSVEESIACRWIVRDVDRLAVVVLA